MKLLRTALVALATTATLSVSAQTGDDIVNKHIEAVGGKNLDKVKSIKYTGSMSVQGMDIDLTQTVVNDKGLRMDFSIMGANCYMIITPDGGWMYMPVQPGMDKVQELPKEQLKDAKDKFNIKTMLVADKSNIKKATLAGKDTLEQIACYKVNITGKDDKEMTCYFDMASYNLLRTEMNVTVNDEEHEVAVSFSDFRKTPEGITLPMKQTNPAFGGDLVYKTAEINGNIPADVFKPTEPAADKADTKK